MDLMDYFGTAMCSGLPMAVMDLSALSQASDQDLIEIAEKAGMDIHQYYV